MSWQNVTGTGIDLKKKVLGKQAADYRQLYSLFAVAWMAFPYSFCKKGTAGLG
jgi:hypothetical protein